MSIKEEEYVERLIGWKPPSNAYIEIEDEMNNKDINALVATEVMGWVMDNTEIPDVNYPPCWCDKNGITHFVRDWNPCENIAQAWQVFKRIGSLRFSERQKFFKALDEIIQVRAWGGNDKWEESHYSLSWPAAMIFLEIEDFSLAALKAVGVLEQVNF